MCIFLPIIHVLRLWCFGGRTDYFSRPEITPLQACIKPASILSAIGRFAFTSSVSLKREIDKYNLNSLVKISKTHLRMVSSNSSPLLGD